MENKPKELRVDNVRYIREDLIATVTPPVLESGEAYEFAIVVADRGHVWVGKVVESEGKTLIYNASIIRYWGTTKGLNELVNGPLSKTKVDAEAPLVKVLNHAVIAVIPANEAEWKKSK